MKIRLPKFDEMFNELERDETDDEIYFNNVMFDEDYEKPNYTWPSPRKLPYHVAKKMNYDVLVNHTDLSKKISSLYSRSNNSYFVESEKTNNVYKERYDYNELYNLDNKYTKSIGIRPIVEIPLDAFNELSQDNKIRLGKYPQDLIFEDNAEDIINAKDKWQYTGVTYSLPSYSKNGKFMPYVCPEVLYNNTKFICLNIENTEKLFKVKNINWTLESINEEDSKANLIADNMLISGAKYSDVNNFLNNYLIKDIAQSIPEELLHNGKSR